LRGETAATQDAHRKFTQAVTMGRNDILCRLVETKKPYERGVKKKGEDRAFSKKSGTHSLRTDTDKPSEGANSQAYDCGADGLEEDERLQISAQGGVEKRQERMKEQLPRRTQRTWGRIIGRPRLKKK